MIPADKTTATQFMLTNDELDRLETYLHKIRKDYPTKQQLDSDNDVEDEKQVEPELRKLIDIFKYEPGGPASGFGGADTYSFSLVVLRLTAFLFYDSLIAIVHRERKTINKPLESLLVREMTAAQLTDVIKRAVRAASTND